MSEQQANIEVRSMLPVGTLLQGGKYRIERYLSSGGFGNTYVAVNTEFEEQVAIKEFFMRGISQRDDDSVSVSVSNETNVTQFTSQKEKFRKEARRLRKLRNNHIVSVHDLFEENGTAYYEMDLIKGESLSERMKHTGGQPLPETEVLSILDQVLDALSVVHAQGLYHLDLKPGNIMVDQTGRALLIDFGASKQMSAGDVFSVSTSSALAFTPGYAPLEQTEQNFKSFGPWTDIYALGATLYKLLTGLTPPSASEILIMKGPLLFPTPVSSKTQRLIAWMMKPRLDERPQSVDDIKRFLAGNYVSEETQVGSRPEQKSEQTKVVSKPNQSEQPKTQLRQKPQETKVEDATTDSKTVVEEETNGVKKRNYILGAVAGLLVLILIIAFATSKESPSPAPDTTEVYDVKPVSVTDEPTGITETNYHDETTPDATDEEFTFDAWSGSFRIEGAIYRMCESLGILDIRKVSKDMYEGSFELLLGERMDEYKFDPQYGWLKGKVRGKVGSNVLTLVLDSYTTQAGSEDDYFLGSTINGQIFRITYNGNSYSATPIGDMEGYFNKEMGLSITK